MNENRAYFIANQKILRSLANDAGGRFLLQKLASGRKSLLNSNRPIVKLTPNSYRVLVDFRGDNSVYKEVFFCDDAVAQVFIPILEKMKIAHDLSLDCFYHYAGLIRGRYLAIYLRTQSFTSGSGNGFVRNSNSDWATAQAAATGTTADYNGSTAFGVAAIYLAPDYYIDRLFLPFDTSSLGANAVVSTTANDNDLTIYNGSVTNANTSSVYIVATTQASTSALVTADFDQAGASSGGVLSLASFSTNANNTIDLNATGAGWITNTGITKLGLRNSRDMDNSAPTGTNQVADVNMAGAASNKPTLLVTFEAPGGLLGGEL